MFTIARLLLSSCAGVLLALTSGGLGECPSDTARRAQKCFTDLASGVATVYDGSSGIIQHFGEIVPFTASLHGFFNLYNLMAAIRAAEEAYSNIVRVDNRVQMQTLMPMQTRNTLFVVADASASAVGGDSTVNEGMAIYSYNVVTHAVTKIYEEEGSDIVLSMESIVDNPATPEQFDTIVRTSHEHTPNSLAVIVALTVDNDGYLQHNGLSLTPGMNMHHVEW